MRKHIALLLALFIMLAGQMASAAPTGTQEKSVLDEVKEMYVCPSNNMYLFETDQAGALCPEGKKVITWVERMIADGWERKDILELVGNLKMGRPLVEKNGQPQCGNDGKLKVEAFIMSYCPYGVKYVTNTLDPMIAGLGNVVEYKPYFIMQKDQTGKLKAMHGQTEVDENLRMICLRDKWGLDVWHKYMGCFAKEIYGNRQNPKDWSFCAEQAGVKPDELDSCLKNNAAQLADVDIKLSQKYSAFASPTAVYNCGNTIVGAIPFQQIKGHLCRLIPGARPESCN